MVENSTTSTIFIDECKNIIRALSLQTIKIERSDADIIFCIFYQAINWLVFAIPVIINLVKNEIFQIDDLLDIFSFLVIYSFVPFSLCFFLSISIDIRYILYLYRLFCYSSIYSILIFLIMSFYHYNHMIKAIFEAHMYIMVALIMVVITFNRNLSYKIKLESKNQFIVVLVSTAVCALHYFFLLKILPY